MFMQTQLPLDIHSSAQRSFEAQFFSCMSIFIRLYMLARQSSTYEACLVLYLCLHRAPSVLLQAADLFAVPAAVVTPDS